MSDVSLSDSEGTPHKRAASPAASAPSTKRRGVLGVPQAPVLAQEFDIKAAVAVARRNPRYFANVPPEDFHLTFSSYMDRKLKKEVCSPHITCKKFIGDFMPQIYGPISKAQWVRLYPGGNMREFFPEGFPAASADAAKYQCSINLHESAEHQAFLVWLQKVQQQLIGEFLNQKEKVVGMSKTPLPFACDEAMRHAEAECAEKWAMRWKFEGRTVILAKPEAERTAEETALLAYGDKTPPIPRAVLEEFLWAKCLTRIDKARKDKVTKAAMPDTETCQLSRNVFHYPNKQEESDMAEAEEKKRPYFDLAAMTEMVGPIVARHAEALFKATNPRLYTILPMYDCDGEQVPPERCNVREGDVLQHVFYFSLSTWSPQRTFGLKCNMDHIIFINNAIEVDRALEAKAAIVTYRIPGAVRYSELARARCDPSLDAPAPDQALSLRE